MLLDLLTTFNRVSGSPNTNLYGKVVANNDPFQLGYVRIRMPRIFEEALPLEQLPWVAPEFPIDSGGSSANKKFRVPPVGALVKIKIDPCNPYNYYYFGWTPTVNNSPTTSPATNEYVANLKEVEETVKEEKNETEDNEDLDTDDVKVVFSGGNSSAVSESSITILKQVGAETDNKRIVITSTARTPHDQARIMYENIRKNGLREQRATYASSGQKVLDAYEESVSKGQNREQTIANMESTIIQIGPANVSKHCADHNILNVFDIAVRPLSNPSPFLSKLKPHTKRVLSENNCYHTEIVQSTAKATARMILEKSATRTSSSELDSMLNSNNQNDPNTTEGIVNKISDQTFGSSSLVELNTGNLAEDYPNTQLDLDANNNGYVYNEKTKMYQWQYNGCIVFVDKQGNLQCQLPKSMKLTVGENMNVDVVQLLKTISEQLDMQGTSTVNIHGESAEFTGTSSTRVKSSGGTSIKGNGVNIN